MTRYCILKRSFTTKTRELKDKYDALIVGAGKSIEVKNVNFCYINIAGLNWYLRLGVPKHFPFSKGFLC